MQIKLQLGRLRLRLPLAQIIARQQQVNSLQLLPVELAHVLALEKLTPHHKDPFDRLLVTQALVENAFLVSADPVIGAYGASVIW